MKKLLFIIPDLGFGGTNPSLEALYNHLKYQYDIKVFAIAHQPRSRTFLFDEVLLPQQRDLSLLFANLSDLSGFNKILAFLIKLPDAILRLCHIDIRRYVCKKSVKVIEASSGFDTVIAYQEGVATQFVSLFQVKNKVAWIHCNYEKWRAKDYSELNLYLNYKNIVCVSDYTASIFSRRYPLLESRVVGVHNFVDSKTILRLGSENIDDARFNNERFTILSVGRFHNIKRFRAIPQIAKYLKEKGVDFCWFVLGDGSDKKEVETFVDNLNNYKVSQFVKWLGGKSNPYPYFKQSDLYVCTSESEACPMVFIEAKLFGIPIVTTDFPSSYEFIENNVNGVITPLEKMSEVLCDILTNNNQYDILKTNVSCFSYDNSRLMLKLSAIL